MLVHNSKEAGVANRAGKTFCLGPVELARLAHERRDF